MTREFLSLYTDDCVYEDVARGSVARGKPELESFYQEVRAAFPDFAKVFVSSMSTEDHGAVQWVMKGTQTGDLPGLPATNKKMSVRGISIFEMRGDKIKELHEYYNFAEALKQLGA